MDIIQALEGEIRDYFRDKIAEDEELSIRYGNGRVPFMIVEFSVAWFDFLLKLDIFYEDDLLQMLRIDGPSERVPVRKWTLEDPSSIDNLLVTMEEEWDSYLGRSKRS